MPHLSNFTYLDFSGEKSTVTIYNGAITAVSLPGFLTEFGALRDSINGLSLGAIQQEQWIGDRTSFSNPAPTDPDAQRERKALVTYVGDVSGKRYTITIPMARVKDSSGNSLLLPGTDLYDLTAVPVAAFISAFEQIGRSPDDSLETVTVESIRTVGRNI